MISAVRRRIDDVGGLPERAAYPVPQPQLPKLLHQLTEQFAERCQVEHSRFIDVIHHPPRLGGAGGLARLLGEAANEGLGQACPIPKPGAVLAGVSGPAPPPIWGGGPN